MRLMSARTHPPARTLSDRLAARAGAPAACSYMAFNSLSGIVPYEISNLKQLQVKCALPRSAARAPNRGRASRWVPLAFARHAAPHPCPSRARGSPPTRAVRRASRRAIAAGPATMCSRWSAARTHSSAPAGPGLDWRACARAGAQVAARAASQLPEQEQEQEGQGRGRRGQPSVGGHASFCACSRASQVGGPHASARSHRPHAGRRGRRLCGGALGGDSASGEPLAATAARLSSELRTAASGMSCRPGTHCQYTCSTGMPTGR